MTKHPGLEFQYIYIYMAHVFLVSSLFRPSRVTATKAAAQKMGVELNSVCSVGVHSFAGYQMMRETYPGLKDESRRGLGLGRKRPDERLVSQKVSKTLVHGKS